jgi:hypothetical protein
MCLACASCTKSTATSEIARNQIIQSAYQQRSVTGLVLHIVIAIVTANATGNVSLNLSNRRFRHALGYAATIGDTHDHPNQSITNISGTQQREKTELSPRFTSPTIARASEAATSSPVRFLPQHGNQQQHTDRQGSLRVPGVDRVVPRHH